MTPIGAQDTDVDLAPTVHARMAAPLAPIFAFWHGPVGWFEQLSVMSAVAVGHQVTVFSYEAPDPLLLTAGARVERAAELWTLRPNHDLGRLTRKPAHFSDHLRLEGLQQGRGIWIDLDCILVRPIVTSEYIFAREGAVPGAKIGSSVLLMPAGSPALCDLLEFYRRRPFKPLPPHWDATKRSKKWVEWKVDGWVRPSKIKTVPGPETLTGALVRHHLAHLAAPSHVFYPLSHKATVSALLPRDDAAALINKDAVMVHMWCKGGGLPGPLANSWLGSIATKVGMPLAAPTAAVVRRTAEIESSTKGKSA